MISLDVIALFACYFCLDVCGHMGLKMGSRRTAGAPPLIKGLLPSWSRSPLVWGSLVFFVLEIAIWIELLSRVPLSLAFPVASVNSCGVLLGSRFLLKEKVPLSRWAGGLLVAVGVALVGSTAP